MQKLFLILIALTVLATGNSLLAQRPGKQPATLGIDFFLNDYGTRAPTQKNRFGKVAKMIPGIAINYTQGIANYYDWRLTIAGSFRDSFPTNNNAESKCLALETNIDLRRKFMDRDNRWQPFIQAGLGGFAYQGNYGIFIPAGAGLQARINEGVYTTFNAQYRLALGDASQSHFFYSIGISGKINRKEIRRKKAYSESPTLPELINPLPALAAGTVIIDTDHDGIMDSLDKCPATPGLVEFDGCPDQDGDGIADAVDLCPTLPGLARLQGCPIPDQDNDGINDEEDECPSDAGAVEEKGCPVIIDSLSAYLNFLAKHILFETNQYILKESSFKSLDEAAVILKKIPASVIQVQGHTDNVGSNSKNMILSQNRAQTVASYLISKGIDRKNIQAVGYGSRLPIADNNSPIERTKNRRVELKITR